MNWRSGELGKLLGVHSPSGHLTGECWCDIEKFEKTRKREMPRYIMKPVKDRDFYVTYSTVVDNVTEFGTRQEYLDDGTEEERLDRADEFGTSQYNRWGDWSETRVRLENLPEDFYRRKKEMRIDSEGGLWMINREDLEEFCEAMMILDTPVQTAVLVQLIYFVQME